MQSIQTRFIGPSDHRGARIRAFSEAFPRGVVVPFSYAGVEGDHDAAARAFIKAKGWFGVWVRGGSADSRGMVYVCLTRHFKGKTLKTPHPQAVDPRDYIVVKEGES